MSQTTLTTGLPITPDHRDIDPATGQQKGYIVLCEAERAKGFVRPVQHTYRHQLCGNSTTMANSIAETFARSPTFYTGTYCSYCVKHFPLGEFFWVDAPNMQVGS